MALRLVAHDLLPDRVAIGHKVQRQAPFVHGNPDRCDALTVMSPCGQKYAPRQQVYVFLDLPDF
jgi:hypothetical protein